MEETRQLITMSFCEYRDIFGAPSTGAHSTRIAEGWYGGFAFVDVIMTIIGAILIAWLSGARTVSVLVILVVLSIVLHWLFCVPTLTNKLIGLA